MITKSLHLVTAVLVLALTSGLQGAAGTTAPATRPTTQKGQTSFKPEELQQLAAPIALYPDPLLAQVLMASTYPVEIVQAERWANENKQLKGEALTKELETKTGMKVDLLDKFVYLMDRSDLPERISSLIKHENCTMIVVHSPEELEATP
jgi:hypothetical protein